MTDFVLCLCLLFSSNWISVFSLRAIVLAFDSTFSFAIFCFPFSLFLDFLSFVVSLCFHSLGCNFNSPCLRSQCSSMSRSDKRNTGLPCCCTCATIRSFLPFVLFVILWILRVLFYLSSLNSLLHRHSASGTSYLNRTEASNVEKLVTILLKSGVNPAQVRESRSIVGARRRIKWCFEAKSRLFEVVLVACLLLSAKHAFDLFVVLHQLFA